MIDLKTFERVNFALRSNDPWIRYNHCLEYWIDDLIEYILKLNDLVHIEKGLDLASGCGFSTFKFAKNFKSVSFEAVDIDRDLINLGKIIAQEKCLRTVEFNVGDVHDLSLESHSYDFITCFFSIMYFKDPVRSINEMLRLKTENGKIFISTWGKRHGLLDVFKKHLIHGDEQHPKNANPTLFSDPDKLKCLLKDITYKSIRTLESYLKWNGDLFELWEFMLASNPWIKEKMHSSDLEKNDQLKSQILLELENYNFEDHYLFPVDVHLIMI